MIYRLLTILATFCALGPARQGHAFDHGHRRWDAILARTVQAGVVDYTELLRSGHGELHAYLAELQAVTSMKGWTRAQRLAFWINAYNAYTVELVLEHWPVKSIRSIGGIFSNPWKIRFIDLRRLEGSKLTLDEIEHQRIRARFKEPRAHFALVCASKSCPPLRSHAYVATRLEAQLDDQARIFLHDRSKNRLDRREGKIRLSKIFRWYGEDFGKREEALRRFLSSYFQGPDRAFILDTAHAVEFLDYDWSLNGR